jgi:hypothetical protein
VAPTGCGIVATLMKLSYFAVLEVLHAGRETDRHGGVNTSTCATFPFEIGNNEDADQKHLHWSATQIFTDRNKMFYF